MSHTLKSPLHALLILLLALPLSLSGCRQPNPNQLRSEPLTAEETVVQAEAGQSFTIVLPGLGTPANYKWVLQDSYNKSLIRFEGERDAASEFPERPPPGYTPKRVFSLRALAVGR